VHAEPKVKIDLSVYDSCTCEEINETAKLRPDVKMEHDNGNTSFLSIVKACDEFVRPHGLYASLHMT
jgi:hypothetical protein